MENSVEIPKDIRDKMMYVLKDEENKTDLENLAVLSRVGLTVTSAKSSEYDADATSASSTALIDLGLKLNQATDHGALTEILLHNNEGYSILMAVNDEYIVFGGLRAVSRIGYYLGYLREVARKMNKLISGDKETEMMLSLEISEVKKLEQQRKEEEPSATKSGTKKPSIEEDKAALNDLLGFLDDWEKEGQDFEELEPTTESNIVSIPKSVSLRKSDIGLESRPADMSPVPERPSQFKVYEDEVAPIPLDDYTPMEIEEETPAIDTTQIGEVSSSQTTIESSTSEKLPPSEQFPSFEELQPPDFDIELSASEYDTEFVLEEESEALGSVLKDLGWDQEDEDEDEDN
ncbi:MAG: hypothetical protein ACFFBI_01605 [Promethearchaeota archaeon]